MSQTEPFIPFEQLPISITIITLQVLFSVLPNQINAKLIDKLSLHEHHPRHPWHLIGIHSL